MTARSETDLVDGYDQLALLHSRQMLDGARDTDGKIQLGSNDLHRAVKIMVSSTEEAQRKERRDARLSSLSDLQIVVGVASIDGCSRSSDGLKD
jgi:hypothetical protein